MWEMEVVTTNAGGRWVCDVARSPHAREVGLQDYPYLAPEQGLIFEWPGEPGQERGFHHGHVPYPIRIVWVLSNVITRVVDSRPGNRASYSARCDWVVEVPADSPLVNSLHQGGTVYRAPLEHSTPLKGVKSAHQRVADEALVKQIQQVLTPELLKPEWRRLHEQGQVDPMTGYCYIATEALYYLLAARGVKTKAMHIKHENAPHWFLLSEDGKVIDPTASQFKTPVPYDKARGKGFLTKAPSARARELMRRLTLAAAPQNGDGKHSAAQHSATQRVAAAFSHRLAATYDPPEVGDPLQLVATLVAQLAQNPQLIRWTTDPANAAAGSSEYFVITRAFIRQLCRVAGMQDELDIDLVTRAVMQPEVLQQFGDALVGAGVATLVKMPQTGVGLVLYRL